MENALEINGLEFSYNAQTPILKIENMTLTQGERVFIYGPSGCGKTTLLGLVSGVLNLSIGSISVLGEKMESKTPHERDLFRGAKIGYIFQMFNLIPYLNAYENIVLPCQLNHERRSRIPGELKPTVLALAQRLGIDQLLDRKVTDLSVGQQQRVAAARALLGQPELIIADEPTSSLDTDYRKAFLDALLEQAALTKATVLFVSHDRELSKLFDRSMSIPELNLVPRSANG